jgi:mannose-6-phosphate isomerase-like protein (cupin superfamily)
MTTAAPLVGNTIGTASSDFVVAEWKEEGQPSDAPPLPFGPVAPPHVHHRDDEAWYVLEGMLCVRLGDEVVEAAAGAAVLVPRGTPHTYWNPEPHRARYLLVMTANIYRLIQVIHALKQRTPDTIAHVFEAYDSALVKMSWPTPELG